MGSSQRPDKPYAARLLERQVERKGLRPRFAAAVIASVWLVAIVAFGVLQHILDPTTFNNIWVGMWWATQTVTTVGYGDTVPDQTVGELIAVVLMVGGLSLFAVVTATITSSFYARAQRQSERDGDAGLDRRLDDLAARLDAISEDLRVLKERPPGSGSR